jgi:hypothetical protein
MDSYTELEGVSGVSEEDSSDDEAAAIESDLALKVLESQLLSVLRHDLALAARLIPQIHHQVKSTLAIEPFSGINDAASDGNGGTSWSPPAQGEVSTSSFIPANNRAGGLQQKRGRESDLNNDQDNDRPKRSRSKLRDDSERNLNFACHFHKKCPQRYNPHVNPKYLHCIFPADIPGLRHIK